MQAQFSGYKIQQKNGQLVKLKLGGHRLKDFWRAFIPGGSDITDGAGYGNIEGNQSGAWVARIDYNAKNWCTSIYADHFFEDHSQQFFLDYDGYGKGADFQKKRKTGFCSIRSKTSCSEASFS